MHPWASWDSKHFNSNMRHIDFKGWPFLQHTVLNYGYDRSGH